MSKQSFSVNIGPFSFPITRSVQPYQNKCTSSPYFKSYIPSPDCKTYDINRKKN